MTGAGNESERAVSKRIDVPPEVEEVFRGFRTCEFSTLTRDGTPIAWPLVPLWQPEERRFVLTTSIGLARKALNVRRDGRVSLLFSDPTASGLEDRPAVLVQCDAEVADEVRTSPYHVKEYWSRLFRIQTANAMYSANPLTRYLMDWYYMRLYIYVRPRRILFWPGADFGQKPKVWEVDHVG